MQKGVRFFGIVWMILLLEIRRIVGILDDVGLIINNLKKKG